MQGTYIQTMLDLAATAVEQGHLGMFGITNANSTGPILRNGGGWQRALPVRLCIPWRFSNRVTSRAATSTWLASDEFIEVASRLDRHPARDLTYRWNPDLLRWRLATPGTRYAVHWSEHLVSVSTKTTMYGVPITLLLKFLPRNGQPGPLSPRSHIAAACRHHRTPAAVYAGINIHVPVQGTQLAQDRLPSPLNLVMYTFDPDVLPQYRFVFDTFELLDFDAF
jgi:hypothetical protein